MADRERIPLVIWLLVAVFVALAALAVVWGVPHVEDDIGSRARTALGDLPVSVTMDGRDAVLSGTTDAAVADQAERIVRTVRGVRKVDNEIVIAALPGGSDTPSPAPPLVRPPPSFEISVVDGIVTLSGQVPSAEAAAELIAAAQAAYGAGTVIDELGVADVTSPDWLVSLPGFLTQLELGDGGIVATEGGAQITGTVRSDEAKVAIGERLAAATGLAVANELVVVPLTPPTFSAAQSAGQVTIEGELATQGAVDDVVAAAEQVYGVGNVSNGMTVGDVDAPEWVGALPGVFGRLTGLDPWTIAVADNTVQIAGQGPDDGSLGTAADAFGDLEAAGLSVETTFEINSESVASALTELLEGSTTFETGSARLSEEATALLDEAIVILLDNPSTRLTVEGHTDDVGSPSANLSLSQERAQAVVDYLVDGGVAGARLTAVGFGEDRPIADNGTSEGRAQNRRIEFVVEEGDG